MANDERIALFNQGVAAWNAWRDENADVLKPDLLSIMTSGTRMACAPPCASPCLWVQAGERRPRHARPAALPWTQEHPTHGQVHRNGARPVQGLLERLLRLATGTNRRVRMLKQSIAALGPELLKFRRGRQYRGGPVDHVGLFGLRRQHLLNEFDRRL